MNTNQNNGMSYFAGATIVTPAIVEAAMQRGRRERSKAFWNLLQAVFSRPEGAGESHPVHQAGDRNASLAR